MHVVFPEQALPAKLTFNPELRMSDDEYFEFCRANPDLRLARTPQGEIIIAPSPGGESSYRSGDGFGHLPNWAKRDGNGRAFSCCPDILRPTRAAVSPGGP